MFTNMFNIDRLTCHLEAKTVPPPFSFNSPPPVATNIQLAKNAAHEWPNERLLSTLPITATLLLTPTLDARLQEQVHCSLHYSFGLLICSTEIDLSSRGEDSPAFVLVQRPSPFSFHGPATVLVQRPSLLSFNAAFVLV